MNDKKVTLKTRVLLIQKKVDEVVLIVNDPTQDDCVIITKLGDWIQITRYDRFDEGRGMIDREITWHANKVMFELELEKFLSTCPNMTGEDDMRDLCDGGCHAYDYCISIEPAESFKTPREVLEEEWEKHLKTFEVDVKATFDGLVKNGYYDGTYDKFLDKLKNDWMQEMMK